MAGVFDPYERLDAAVEVAVHHIGRSDVDDGLTRVLKREDARVLQKAPKHRTHPDVLAESGYTGAQGANTAHDHIDGNPCLRGAIERVDNRLVHHGVALDLDARLLARLMVLNFAVDALNESTPQRTRGDE